MQPKISKIQQVFQQLTTEKFDFQVLIRINLTSHQWSAEMINEDIEKCKNFIETIVKEAKDEIDLLKKLLPLISDFLFLKGGIYSVYNHLKLYCKNLRKDDLYQSFKNMSFSDFVVLILRMVQQKDTLGLLLSSIRVPLPIYLKVAKKPVKMTELLKGIMSIDNMSLILNCGSEKARKCGKTTFLFELFSLPKDYAYKESQFYEDSVYIHKVFPGSRNNLLADFNGSFERMPTDVSLLHKNCGLLMVHILQTELCNEDGKNIGAEYFKNIEDFFIPPQKVILLIRNCDVLKVEDVLGSLGDLQKKCFVFCLTKDVDSMQYFEVAEGIQKNKLFQLKKTFNYFDILNDPSKTQNVQVFYKESEKIIQMLPTQQQVQKKENLTKVLFPHLFLSNQISLLNSTLIQKQFEYNLISEEDKQKELKKLDQIQKEIAGCQLLLKTGSEISQFVKRGFEILTNGIRVPEQVQVFNTRLHLWKKKMVRPLLNQYIKISKIINDLGPAEKLKKEQFLIQAEKIQVKLDMYDISLTTILNDVITKLTHSDENSESEKQKQARRINLATIETSYNHSYRSMYPINLVDGKNLLFGNKYLKDFCQKLSLEKRFEGKKVYIISVVGAQSSGKSTLLNYLFRCQFETSAGRCTKGMYFNICEMDDKVIWLIDTEGLLSLNARDPLFDNKIATFVLSISDIVIINNKGELTSQMRDMLEICTFAMKYLRKEDKVGAFKPQKLIFALRDQTIPKSGEKFQQQMVSKIMTQFEKSKEKLNLNYKQYLDIQPDDIISFPSVFNEGEVKIKALGTFESYSQTFGRCVVGLRSRIMSILDKEEGRKSIFDCYTQAEFCWGTILKCGSNLMNYKSRQELDAKEYILKKFFEFLPNFNKELKEQFQGLFKFLTKDKNAETLDKKEVQIKTNLIQKKRYMAQNFQTQLRTYCGPVCSRNEWYEVCNRKIVVLCQIYENQNIDLFNKYRVALHQQQAENGLKQSIQKQVDELLLKKTNKSQIFDSLEKKKEAISGQYDSEIEKQKKIIYEMDIAEAFQQGFKEQKVSTMGAFWVSEYKRLKQKKNYEDMFTITYKHLYNFLRAQDKNDMQEFFVLLLKKIKQMCKKNNAISSLNKIKDLSDMAQELDKNLSLIHKQVQQKLNIKRLNKDVMLSLLGYDKIKMKDVLRGCLIYRINKIFSEKQLYAIMEKKQKCLQLLKVEQQKITLAFENKDNIEKISLSWIQQIRKFYEVELKKSCKEKLQAKLNLLKKDFDPQNIVDEAFRISFLNPISDKNKWIQCFKMICDTNKYLFEILCKQQLIQTRKAISSSLLSQQKVEIEKRIQEQCMNIIENIENLQQNHENINKIKQKYRLIHTSNFSNKDILKVMKAQLKDAETFTKFIDQIKASVANNELNADMQKYINETIKDSIIGCQDTCPFCGVKCKKNKGHEGSHEVKISCHVMACFEGWYTEGSFAPTALICGSRQALLTFKYNSIGTRVENIGDAVYRSALEHVQKYFANWYGHFKEMVDANMFQTSLQEKRYQEIWANVKQMLLKHKYIAMKDDGRFNQLMNQPLNDQDLQNTYFINLQGEKIPLSNYLQKKWF